MDRSKAEDVLQTFLAGITNLDQSKILQVTSDGSNVNRLFLIRIQLSHERKKSCYFFFILVGVGFTFSMNKMFSKTRVKKKAIANLKKNGEL